MPTMISMTPNMTPPSTLQISPTTESIPGNSPTNTSSATSSGICYTAASLLMYWHVSHPHTEVGVTPTNTNGDISGMGDSDDDDNSDVVIGVVVSLVGIIFIVVAAVIAILIWRRHTRQRKYPPATAGLSETTQSNGANGSAPRPTTIQLSSQTPLLNLTGPNAYTDTATLPQPIDGAPMPYGNVCDGINNDGDDVSDSDLDKTTNDSSAVDI